MPSILIGLIHQLVDPTVKFHTFLSREAFGRTGDPEDSRVQTDQCNSQARCARCAGVEMLWSTKFYLSKKKKKIFQKEKNEKRVVVNKIESHITHLLKKERNILPLSSICVLPSLM